MKRAIVVATLCLALLVAVCGEAFSRSVPVGYVDPSTGDDHTWGGDSQAGPGNPGGIGGSINSGWTPIDVIITQFVFKWLATHNIGIKTDVKADYFVGNQVKEVESPEPTTQTTGGLQ